MGAFSKVQSYSNRYIATLERNYDYILTAIADTGRKMGMTAAVNGIARSVTLNSSALTFQGYAFGVIKYASLTVTAKEDNRTLDIVATVSGNFGSGAENDAAKLVDEFKAKLRARLGEK